MDLLSMLEQVISESIWKALIIQQISRFGMLVIFLLYCG